MSNPAFTAFARTLCATGLVALSMPAFAVGAQCPASSATSQITTQFHGNVMRCIARGQAAPVCPPTHPIYRIMPEQSGQSQTDYCAPTNIVAPAPSQRADVMCPPGLNVVVNGGNGNRDICRAGHTTQVAPLIVPN